MRKFIFLGCLLLNFSLVFNQVSVLGPPTLVGKLRNYETGTGGNKNFLILQKFIYYNYRIKLSTRKFRRSTLWKDSSGICFLQ